MTGNALLSDGSNEITGSNITYDLGREIVTASNNGTGQVRMKFTPRKKPEARRRPRPRQHRPRTRAA